MKECPDCMEDENAIGQGARCGPHEIAFLRAEVEKANFARTHLSKNLDAALLGHRQYVEKAESEVAALKAERDAAMMRLNAILNDECLDLRTRREDGRYVAMDLETGETFGPFGSPVEAIDAYLAPRPAKEDGNNG